jgi:hypothetical protein
VNLSPSPGEHRRPPGQLTPALWHPIADLEKALSASNDTLIFIESVMDPFDAPNAVINSGNNGADLDYGPRGPQHRGNMLIRPAT